MPESPGEDGKGNSPNMGDPATKIVRIVVKSVMQGVKKAAIHVREDATVQTLKLAIEMVTDVVSDKQVLMFKGKELRDNESTISTHGITNDSEITMNIKMSTGLFSKPTATDMIFLVPAILPNNQDQLRKTIKGMNTVSRKPKKMSGVDENASIWTPEKQLESELTRNRMKTLLRRKKTPILSSTPVDSEAGSVQTFSPVATPPSEMSPITSEQKRAETEDSPVTEKELKLYFDPPETLEEYRRNRKSMFLPASSIVELEGIIAKFAEEKKIKCNMCFKKLSASQQTMQCKCKKVFCDRHRLPQQHMCVIDYKQDGRVKLKKENSKCGEGGVRKAKFQIT